MAKTGELSEGARDMALARYGHIHKSPERTQQAKAYAQRLGLSEVGRGLGPAESA